MSASGLYHEIRNIDAATLMRTAHNEIFDLVVIGDCIEHMPKSTAIDLLNFLTYRARYILVLAPEFCVQGTAGDIESESHVAVWSEADFFWHDAWAFDNCCTISLFVLRGYQPSPVPIKILVHEINKRNIPAMDFYRKNIARAANLSLNIRRRTEVSQGQEISYRNF